MKFLMTTAAVLIIAGCSLFNGGEHTTSTYISVSFQGTAAPASVDSRSIFDIYPVTDETYYKEHLKEENRGTLIGSYTPEQFFLDIDYILLYLEQPDSDEFVIQRILPDRTTPGGTYIPRHINVIHARQFIREVEVAHDFWDGFSMKFLPHRGTSGNVFYVKSLIGVNLGADYAGIVLDQQITDDELLPDDGLHYFTFDYLQPFKTGFLGYITIGENITEKGIQNPSGDSGIWNIPGDPPSLGNSSQAFFPGESLDLSVFTHPEIVFFWNMSGLIEVYDRGSDDPSMHVVTFALANPFPVCLSLQEMQPGSLNGDPGDTEPPDDVLCAAAVVLDDSIVLQWINPKDEDFHQVIIMRKEGSPPAGLDDGDEVYSGHEPNFCDTLVQPGITYFYRVYAVDHSGNSSSGIVVSTVIN